MADPVLIAGAGIGGLTLALLLAGRGVPVRVFERSASLDEVGAGLQLTPNAGRILDAVPGLGALIDRSAVRPRALRFIDGVAGETLTRLELGEAAERRWGAPYRVIHRADLQAALIECVQRRFIGVTLAAEVVDVEDSRLGLAIKVRTPSGLDVVHGSALIGADGVRSRVRGLIGDRIGARFTGTVAWRGLAPADRLPRGLPTDETGLWLGPGVHAVHYPIASGRLVNLVAVAPGPEGTPSWSQPREPGELDELLHGWALPVIALVRAATQWTAWPLYERPTGGVWQRGRVALLGDAAHAMVPHLAQGAAQAIEDAAVLAQCLEASGGTRIEASLAAYEAARRKRAERIELTARRNGWIYRLGGPMGATRNAVLRRMTSEALARQVDWIFGHTA